MKLLEKKKIISLKNNERAVEINEGAKLARKVDSLRQIHADEQLNLLKFRNETIKKVQSEIDTYFKEKSELKDEIKALRQEKEKLLIPLDKQWKEVHDKEEELISLAKNLQKEHLNNSVEKQDIEIEKQLLKEEQLRITNDKSRIKTLLSDAEIEKDKAHNVFLSAKAEEKTKLKIISEKQKTLELKKEELAYFETDLRNKDESLEGERKFIKEEKIRLADMRGTLERQMNRIKNK